jgi:chorismate mutase
MRDTITLWPERARRLEQLRTQIDALDDALLDLVEQRLALSLKISALKDPEDGRLKLRPRREAGIVARLTARARLATPELIAQLWRELMSHSLQAQAPTELVLCAMLNPDSLRDQVRERFGWAAPIVWAQTPDEALDQAARREAIAVIEHSPFTDWWVRLAGERSLAIFAATRLADGGLGALIVGRIAAEDVPENHHFEILEEEMVQDRLERGEPVEAVAAAGALRLCRVPPDRGGGCARQPRSEEAAR